MRRKLLIALPVLAVLLIAVLLSGGDVDLRTGVEGLVLGHGDPSWGPVWRWAERRSLERDREASIRRLRRAIREFEEQMGALRDRRVFLVAPSDIDKEEPASSD